MFPKYRIKVRNNTYYYPQKRFLLFYYNLSDECTSFIGAKHYIYEDMSKTSANIRYIKFEP